MNHYRKLFWLSYHRRVKRSAPTPSRRKLSTFRFQRAASEPTGGVARLDDWLTLLTRPSDWKARHESLKLLILERLATTIEAYHYEAGTVRGC